MLVFLPMSLGGVFIIFIASYDTRPISYPVIKELEKLSELKSKKASTEERKYLRNLQTTTWLANYSAASLTTPILITIASIIISYMSSQQQTKNKFLAYLRKIILFFITLGIILSGLSMEFWVSCLDQARSEISEYISCRGIATFLNLASWLSVYIAIFLLVSIVSPNISFFASVLGTISVLFYILWNTGVSSRFKVLTIMLYIIIVIILKLVIDSILLKRRYH